MTTYSVHFGSMQQANEGLVDVYNKMTSLVETLNQEINSGLVDFQGPTREQFLQIQKEYNDQYTELTASLNQASASLGGILDTYTHAERNGTQMWS